MMIYKKCFHVNLLNNKSGDKYNNTNLEID